MHRSRGTFFWSHNSRHILYVGILLAIASTNVTSDLNEFISPAFLAGIAAPLANVSHLAFLVTAGIIAVAQGIWLPILLALSAVAGTTISHLGSSLSIPVWGLALPVLFFGWLMIGHHSISRIGIAILGAIASLLHGLTYSLIPWNTNEITAYLMGLLLCQLTISFVAYQAAFWLLWHLGDQAAKKFRLGGLMACGVAAVYLSSIFIG